MTDTGLYSWQKHALDAWYARKRGIIQATTGSGKTRCAVHAYLKVNPRICYVVVPKVALLHEWYEEFSTAGITASRIGGKYKEEFSDVNIITINTARKLLHDALPFDAMLIVDEVHRSSSQKNRLIYKPKWEWCLGISATAFQGGTGIAALCGGLVYDYNFEDALSDGVVNDYKITNIGYDVGRATRGELNAIAERLRILRGIITTEYGGPSSDDQWPMFISELVADGEPSAINMQHLWLERKRLLWCMDIRTDITCELIKQHENDRIVVFHQEIAGVEEIYKALIEDHDFDAKDISKEHSGMDRKARELNINNFRNNVSSILISCRTLDEGFNVPNVSVGIISASSSTSTQFIQRMGRILRKKGNVKASHCYRISAKNTVDEYATHNLLSSGAVDAGRVEFRNWDENKQMITTEYATVGQSTRLSAVTLGKNMKGRYFVPGRTRKDKTFISGNTDKLSEYLLAHGFECGRFRISHDNNLYIWVNERFANIGRSPISWQDLIRGENRVKLPVNWVSMYNSAEEVNA